MKRIVLLLLSLFIFFISFSQWNGNAALGGTGLCTAQSDERNAISVSDGSNGSIVVFQSFSDRDNLNIYAQRINADGMLLWNTATDPKPVCLEGGLNDLTDVIPDGFGGVFIAMTEPRELFHDDVYVQHLDNNGNPLWALVGIKVSNNAATENFGAKLCTDGSGGIIITWNEQTTDINNVITYLQAFAQRINSSGVIQWPPAGVQLGTESGMRNNAEIVTDGAGGAIILFSDTRNSNYYPDSSFQHNNTDIYAQRINNNGDRLWTSNGIAICTAINNQFLQGSTISDGVGGAIILFADYRNGNDSSGNLYAQRVNDVGTVLWADGGMKVRTSGSPKAAGKAVSDSKGGMIITWAETSLITHESAIYSQRISDAGNTMWGVDGVLLDVSLNFISAPAVSSDGLQNFIVSWARYTDVAFAAIKAQKINAAGIIQWAGGGSDIDTYASYANSPQVVTSNNGSVIIIWTDDRNANTSARDLYAAKSYATGALPFLLTEFNAVAGNASVVLKWATQDEYNTNYFEIEKSGDNSPFRFMNKLPAAGNSSGTGYYIITDYNPFNGVSYYRLKSIDRNGAVSYSAVKKVTMYLAEKPGIKILGNPAPYPGTILITSNKAQMVNYTLLGVTGQTILHGNKQLISGGQKLELKMNNLPKGVYQLVIYGQDELIKVSIEK